MIKNIKKSGAWKKVNIDHKLLSENNFDDLISFEELHDYELVNEVSAALTCNYNAHRGLHLSGLCGLENVLLTDR